MGNKRLKSLVALVVSIFFLSSCASNIQLQDIPSEVFKKKIEEALHTDLHSKCLIFPYRYADSAEILKYYKEDGIADGAYFFYMVCHYSEDEYHAEIDRLKNIDVKFDDYEKKIIYSEEIFSYPSYISVFDGYDSYEYALLNDKNNEVVYICDQLISLDNAIIPNDQKPVVTVLPDELCDNGKKGYSLYYTYDNNGNGFL